MLLNTISCIAPTPRYNSKKIKRTEYEATTPIQAARKIGPAIYAARITNNSMDVYVYNFDIQEILANKGENAVEKRFSYTCETTVSGESAKHIVKPKPKKRTIKKELENIEKPSLPPIQSFPVVQKKICAYQIRS